MAGFPGQTKTLSDIYYNRYRDHDSSLGRYIQADPIGLGGGSNPYLYADANPLKFADPAGLNPAAVEGAVVVGEAVGEGFVWRCRSNLALCARTIGPPIVRAARAINAAGSAIAKWCRDDDDNGCKATASRSQAMAAAYAFAGIPVGGGRPLPWKDFRPPPGMSDRDLADFRRQYDWPPYGHEAGGGSGGASLWASRISGSGTSSLPAFPRDERPRKDEDFRI